MSDPTLLLLDDAAPPPATGLRPVICPDTGRDITALIASLSAANDCPPRLLLALCIAESGLREHAIREAGGCDYSYGLCQQSVCYLVTKPPDWRFDRPPTSADNLIAARRFYWDAANALNDAAPRLRAHLARAGGDELLTLCLYNAPSLDWAHPDPQHAANRENYRRALAAARAYEVGTDGPVGTVAVDHDRGHPAGAMNIRPRGLLLHGSRSTVRRTIRQEYDGTRAWARNAYVPSGDYYLGWHVTVGEDAYSVHMTPREWGWNVGADSSFYWAMELAQWDVSQAITDAQIRAAAAAVKTELLPVWGSYDWENPIAMQMHSERPQGISAGKSDTFPRGDARGADLKRRLRAALP